MKPMRMENDALGFPLVVEIEIGDFEHAGTHRAWEDLKGNIAPGKPHAIQLQSGLEPDYLVEVIAHEVYHLFYSVREIITVDEEEQATVFGQLVKHIHTAYCDKAA